MFKLNILCQCDYLFRYSNFPPIKVLQMDVFCDFYSVCLKTSAAGMFNKYSKTYGF